MECRHRQNVRRSDFRPIPFRSHGNISDLPRDIISKKQEAKPQSRTYGNYVGALVISNAACLGAVVNRPTSFRTYSNMATLVIWV